MASLGAKECLLCVHCPSMAQEEGEEEEDGEEDGHMARPACDMSLRRALLPAHYRDATQH